MIPLTVQSPVDRIARLMATDPQLIQPLLLVEQQDCLTGQLELSLMYRLMDMLCASNNEILSYQLEFGRDEEGFAYITGKFVVVLKLKCQRCMNPMDIELNNAISLGIISSRAESNSLPERYEPLVLADNNLSLMTLLEDEVILGMPMAPQHKLDQCPSRKITEQHVTTKENPFAVLKELKLKK